MSLVTKSQRKSNFVIARKLALQLDPGRVKRAKSAEVGQLIGNTYSALVTQEGKRYVVGDTMDDIPYPTCIINGKPALLVKNYHTPLKLN